MAFTCLRTVCILYCSITYRKKRMYSTYYVGTFLFGRYPVSYSVSVLGLLCFQRTFRVRIEDLSDQVEDTFVHKSEEKSNLSRFCHKIEEASRKLVLNSVIIQCL